MVSEKVGYKEYIFPEWEGYKNLEQMEQLLKISCFNNTDEIVKYAVKISIERQYFKDMLLFIQAKLNNQHDGKPLGLCLNSAREVHEIMIVPCED